MSEPRPKKWRKLICTTPPGAQELTLFAGTRISTKPETWRPQLQSLVLTCILSMYSLQFSNLYASINKKQGIYYFVSHRSLWKPLLSKLVPTMSLSVAVVAFMFAVAYVPQAAVLFFVNGPLAAFTTILLTLSESSTLINILSRTFLLQDALVDTFDGVLVARRQTGVLAEGRQLKSGNFNDPIAKLGKLVKSPFEKYSPKALIRYVM